MLPCVSERSRVSAVYLITGVKYGNGILVLLFSLLTPLVLIRLFIMKSEF